MKTLIVSLFLAVVLSGCNASFPKKPEFLDNRVTCTAAKDKAFVTSLYGWFGISTELSEKDLEFVCK